MGSEIKGLGMRSWMAAFQELYGAEAWERMQAAMRPDLKEMVQGSRILASSWYPTELYDAMLTAGYAGGPAGRRIAYDVSYRATMNDLNGIYRFMMGLMGPSMLARNFHRIVDTYSRGTKCTCTMLSPFEAEFSLADVQISRNGWQDLLGGLQAVFDVSVGVGKVKIKITAGGTGTTCTILAEFPKK